MLNYRRLLYSSGLRGVNLVIPFFSYFLLFKGLDVEKLGLWILLNSINQILIIPANLGLNFTIIRFQLGPKILTNSFILRNLVFCVLWLIVAIYFTLNDYNSILLLFIIPGLYELNSQIWLWQTFKEEKTAFFIGVVQKFILVIFSFMVFYRVLFFEYFIIGYSFFTLLILFYVVIIFLKKTGFSINMFSQKQCMEILNQSKVFLSSSLLTYGFSNGAKLILGFSGNMSALAAFDYYLKTFQLSKTPYEMAIEWLYIEDNAKASVKNKKFKSKILILSILLGILGIITMDIILSFLNEEISSILKYWVWSIIILMIITFTSAKFIYEFIFPFNLESIWRKATVYSGLINSLLFTLLILFDCLTLSSLVLSLFLSETLILIIIKKNEKVLSLKI